MNLHNKQNTENMIQKPDALGVLAQFIFPQVLGHMKLKLKVINVTGFALRVVVMQLNNNMSIVSIATDWVTLKVKFDVFF